VSFSINTNVSSLQAQNYLRVNSDFQGKTINRVTSGLRTRSGTGDRRARTGSNPGRVRLWAKQLQALRPPRVYLDPPVESVSDL
jgi:hypothetical protein